MTPQEGEEYLLLRKIADAARIIMENMKACGLWIQEDDPHRGPLGHCPRCNLELALIDLDMLWEKKK